MATRVAQLRDNDAPDYPAAMRDVARYCIHGVDRNPMAVELAKLALWIETVEPGKPLGFLDANIQCGDSLLGIFDLKALEEGIPDDAYKPLTGDDKEAAKWFAKRNKAEKAGQGSFDWARGGGGLPPARLAAEMEDLRHLPEDTVEQVEAKRKRFVTWTTDPKRWATKVACDLYTSAFLLPKKGDVPANANIVAIPTTAHVRTRLAGGSLYGPLEAAAIDAAEYARAFHWPLAFPEVLIARGGFDVVLGNPPWERIKLQEQEFFATLAPEIALATNASTRGKLIRKLANSERGSPARQLFDQFELSKRIAEASSVLFTAPKDEDPTKMDLAKIGRARRYPWTGRGDVNTYALFAELFLNLTSPTGQAGLIVPTGIATDATTAPFFSHLVRAKRLARLFDFENSGPIFAGVHRSYKFALLTLSHDVEAVDFAFYLTSPSQLDARSRRFTLTPEQIARINPNTKTAPVFRAQADADLTARIYGRVPILIDEEKGPAGNPWAVSLYAKFFHLTEDVGLFRTIAQMQAAGAARQGVSWSAPASSEERGVRPGLWLPLHEGEFGFQFDHRFATRDGPVVRDALDEEKRDTKFEIEPTYWVHEDDFEARLLRRGTVSRSHMFGMRRVSSSTNERTSVAAVLPFGPVTYGWILFFSRNATDLALLCATLNSLVFDYCLRNKLSQPSIPQGVVHQIATLPPSAYNDADRKFILSRVLELTYTSEALGSFARDLGYTGVPFSWDANQRAHLRADLDAWYALAYGLSRDELRYVLDPKEAMGADYPSETFRVLQKNEIAKYGEYRTARLVMAACDRLVNEGMRPRTEAYR